MSSATGGSLFRSLTYVGVVTTPIVVPTQPVGPILPFVGPKQAAAVKQLGTDVQALWTELQSLAATSGLTVADLESLATDGQSIAQAGFQFNTSALNPVISELANAVAGGTPTGTAQSAFTTLFNGSSVSNSVIMSTFNDLVTAIGDSGVTTADLATVAKDEAAIQTDISNLPGHLQPAASAQANITADVTGGVIQPIAFGGPPSTNNPPPIIFQPPIIFGPQPIGPQPSPTAGLFGSLNYVGVVTSPVVVINFVASPPSSSTSTLLTDRQALQTELESLAAKSGLTIADLESLALDDQSITSAGFHFNTQKLNPVISELANAVAGGSSTTQAQTDFAALFTGKVSNSVVTATFNDLVKAIQDSNVTTADLATVAKDEAAIQSDLSNLHKSKGGTGTPGTGNTGTGTQGSGSSGSGTTGTGTTGTGTTGTGTTGKGTTGTGTTGKSSPVHHGHHTARAARVVAHAHGDHDVATAHRRK